VLDGSGALTSLVCEAREREVRTDCADFIERDGFPQVRLSVVGAGLKQGPAEIVVRLPSCLR
jgi:hypothetical protein